MVNQQIVDYIKANSSNGHSLDDIKQKILDSGASQADLDEAIKAAGVGEGSEVQQPSEEAAKEQPAEEKPAEQTEEQPAQQGVQPPQKQEGTFKWWVITIPAIVLIIMWVILYFFLS